MSTEVYNLSIRDSGWRYFENTPQCLPDLVIVELARAILVESIQNDI